MEKRFNKLIKPFTPVLINWYDTEVSSSWEKQDNDRKLCPLATIGMYCKCNNDTIYVSCSHYNSDNEIISSGIQIPLGAINSIDLLIKEKQYKSIDKLKIGKIVEIKWIDSSVYSDWFKLSDCINENTVVTSFGAFLRTTSLQCVLVSSFSEDDESLKTIIPSRTIIEICSYKRGKTIWHQTHGIKK